MPARIHETRPERGGRRWLAGRAAWARITTIGLLAAMFQSCYFLAVSLTSASLATLVTIGSSPVLVLAAEKVLWPRRRSAPRPAGQATARRTTPVAQTSTTAQTGTSTANACHTAAPVRVPAESTRAASTV